MMTWIVPSLGSRRVPVFLFLSAVIMLSILFFEISNVSFTPQNSLVDSELLLYKKPKLVFKDSIPIKTVRTITSLFSRKGVKLILIEPQLLLQLTYEISNEDIFSEYSSESSRTLRVVTFLSEGDVGDKLNAPDIRSEHAGNGNYLCDLGLHVLVLIIKATAHDGHVRYDRIVQVPKQFAHRVSMDRLAIGRFDASVDWYGSHHVKTDLIIPKRHTNFLRQLKYSRYVGCNRTRSEDFLIRYPQPRNKDLEQTVIEYIKEMKRITTELEIPFWIMSGITLGWFRQCGVIPYTGDIDMAVYAHDYSPKLLQLFQSSRFLRPAYSIGEPEFGYLLRLNQSLDLCFVYNDKNTSWIGTYDFDQYKIYKSLFPKIRLCSTELLSQRILVPCDTEAMLTAEYGPDWFTPKEDYYYLSGAKNMRLFKTLSVFTWHVVKNFE